MKYFTLKEFDCPCCGVCKMDQHLLDKVDLLREKIGIPLKINSGYRCMKHNAEVGGKPSSQHLLGKAADVSITNMDLNRVHAFLGYIKELEFTGVGIGRTFIHVDVRQHPASWVY